MTGGRDGQHRRLLDYPNSKKGRPFPLWLHTWLILNFVVFFGTLIVVKWDQTIAIVLRILSVISIAISAWFFLRYYRRWLKEDEKEA